MNKKEVAATATIIGIPTYMFAHHFYDRLVEAMPTTPVNELSDAMLTGAWTGLVGMTAIGLVSMLVSGGKMSERFSNAGSVLVGAAINGTVIGGAYLLNENYQVIDNLLR